MNDAINGTEDSGTQQAIKRKLEMSDKVVLGYSGGLDTSICIKWIKEKCGFEVVILTANMGHVRDWDLFQKRAKQCGAIKSIVVDVNDVFVTSLIFPALQTGACNILFHPAVAHFP